MCDFMSSILHLAGIFGQEQSRINIPGSLTVSRNITLDQGSTFNIAGTMSAEGSVTVEYLSEVNVTGSLELHAGSEVIVGQHSLFDIPLAVTVTVIPSVKIVIGKRSILSFQTPLMCTFTKDFVVGDFKNVVINSSTPDVFCF